MEELFRAYFVDAEDVGEVDVLKEDWRESGLDAGRLDQLFAEMLGTEQLIAEQRAVRVQGVNSVPTFFVNGEAVTSGAHKPELLAAFLGQALGPGLSQCSSENGTCGLRPAIEAAVYGGIALGAGIELLVSAKRRRRIGYLNEEAESCRARMGRLHPSGQHLGARRRFVNGPDERVA